MDDPAQEIVNVVKLITTAASPDIQKAAFERFFTPDAGFQHPLCTVAPGPGSRDRILAIYQWYRNMSPQLSLDVESFVYDAEQAKIYLNITQKFHIFISPFQPAPAHLLVRITLRKGADGRFHISKQEDFYQPEDILYLVIPPLVKPLALLKHLAARMCAINTAAFQLFGFWRPDSQKQD